MKILFLWQAKYPHEVRLAKMAEALNAEGHEVSILCRHSGDLPEREVLNGVEIHRVGARFKGRARALTVPVWLNPVWRLALRRKIKEFGPDLLIVRDIPLGLLGVKAARGARIPVLLDMAEHYPEAMRSWDKYAHNPLLRKIVFDWKIPDWIERRTVTRMDGIVVVCQEQKTRLCGGYGYPEEKVSVVLNTPELAAYEGISRGAAENPPKTFAYHGILCADRELETIVHGFEIAAKRNPRLKLLICGDGETMPLLRGIADQSQVSERIEFTGRYTPPELPGLYARADFGIVSLRVSEFTHNTLANKFFDYAALGKPFIFTRVRPTDNLMKTMKCGVGFDGGNPQSVAEAMEALLAGDYETLSRNGVSQVEKQYNWDVDRGVFSRFITSFSPARG